jgi:heptosyltransferase III
MKNIPGNIIISRTDGIGDVVLTLPMAACLKLFFPNMVIAFMGQSYTRPVIEACRYVDQFIDVNDFLNNEISIKGESPAVLIHVFPNKKIAFRAKELKIPCRIGTTHRWFHWFTCNKLYKLSRRNSKLHESQLNLKLLTSVGVDRSYSLNEIELMNGFKLFEPLESKFERLIDKGRYNLIIHPKSRGNGREWPLEYYIELIKLLDPRDYKIFVSGTQKERLQMDALFEKAGNYVTDITGVMSLGQFISFISQCNGMVASGTGPVHLAASAGIDAIGIYPPIKPVHPGRWRPIGKKVKVFVVENDCNNCLGKPLECLCISKIKAEMVKEYLDNVA